MGKGFCCRVLSYSCVAGLSFCEIGCNLARCEGAVGVDCEKEKEKESKDLPLISRLLGGIIRGTNRRNIVMLTIYYYGQSID